MVTHTQNLCSAFNPSKCTHSSEHTPGAVGSQCCGARGAVGGPVPCSRVSPQSWYWGWRERWLFTPPTYNPCRTWDSNPRPSGYKSNSLSIRPRLPWSPLYGEKFCNVKKLTLWLKTKRHAWTSWMAWGWVNYQDFFILEVN